MSNLSLSISLVLVFASILGLGQIIIGSIWDRADRHGRINRRMRLLDSGLSSEEVFSSLKVHANPNGAPADTIWLRILDGLSKLCQQAGVATNPVRLVTFAAGGALGVWAIAAILPSGGNIGVMAGVALIGAVVLAFLILFGWLRGRQEERIRQIDEQLPLALDVMTRALRAGHPVISTVALASREMQDPMGTEFGLIVDEVTFGSDLRVALQSFAARSGSENARYLTVAINIQAESGGNLVEILESIARTMRGRHMLRKRVRALSSEGRMSAYVLSALPAGLISFQLLVNPKFYTDKFSDPIFWPTVGCVSLLYLVGWLMMHRIMNFRY